MIREKTKDILSFNGISMIIGITGGLSTFLSVIITNWNYKVELKWLILTVYIFFTIILFLLKLILDLNSGLELRVPNTSSVVRYIAEGSTFLVSKNDFLGHQAMVSIFYSDDSYEVELGHGYVKNIQENFIQIQLLAFDDDFTTQYPEVIQKVNTNDINSLQRLVIKSYITYTNYTR